MNECYNILRDRGKQTVLEEAHLEFVQTKEQPDYSELYQAVNMLKDELRIPVILYYMEDFNVKEIAQILEISEGAVQKRLARARGKLKRTVKLQEVFV